MSALSSLPKTSGVSRTENPSPAARPSREAGKATRETNSALKTRMGLGAAEKQRITGQGPRSCETEPAPQGRHGSSSVELSAFRAGGCPTRRQTQRSSTACRKCAEHIQAVPARQPLFAVIIGRKRENLSRRRAGDLSHRSGRPAHPDARGSTLRLDLPLRLSLARGTHGQVSSTSGRPSRA